MPTAKRLSKTNKANTTATTSTGSAQYTRETEPQRLGAVRTSIEVAPELAVLVPQTGSNGGSMCGDVSDCGGVMINGVDEGLYLK
ncbi:hypothetical protein JG688_00008544 [Phytophthora aleatoria]|uniref:Uncharacterized protein n=1 Tax=Phytophthora aleatoria TaxID=2496075 RepID=A0A8J5IY92_9STRA|nr:hypothetical protein JG688_00008544 [Phytophthora aleatoria]